MIHKKVEMQVDYESVHAVWDGTPVYLYTYAMEESPELPNSKKRPAVVICPGGGYEFKSDREAEIVAMRYLAAGMQAFVLQYSVAPSRYPCALLELATAVAYIRTHAKEYFVDSEKIVIAGFSAGGHLCASLGTLWVEPVVHQALGNVYPENSWKPDGMILSYPVITMGEFTHEGSRDNLLGKDYTDEMIEALSLEKRVSEKTVPAFIWHTQEDDCVPVENSLEFALAMRKHHIPFELHIYEIGPHGLSLCDDTVNDGNRTFPVDNANWMEMAIKWLKRL